MQACFSALGQDTVYLRDVNNDKSDVEADLTLDPDTHQGVCAPLPRAGDGMCLRSVTKAAD